MSVYLCVRALMLDSMYLSQSSWRISINKGQCLGDSAVFVAMVPSSGLEEQASVRD